VKRFFDRLYASLSRLAASLGLPEDYLLGLSAYESQYDNNHNMALHNPFGLTAAGGNNLRFKSVDDAVKYWKGLYGDQVQGATSAANFVQRLEGKLNGTPVEGWHRYNSVNSNWEENVTGTINSIAHRKDSWKAGP